MQTCNRLPQAVGTHVFKKTSRLPGTQARPGASPRHPRDTQETPKRSQAEEQQLSKKYASGTRFWGGITIGSPRVRGAQAPKSSPREREQEGERGRKRERETKVAPRSPQGGPRSPQDHSRSGLGANEKSKERNKPLGHEVCTCSWVYCWFMCNPRLIHE